jgi:hypothetical protein
VEGSSEPILCPSGFFNDKEGATGFYDCKFCKAGFYCPKGSSVELMCPTGTISDPGAKSDAECFDEDLIEVSDSAAMNAHVEESIAEVKQKVTEQ